MPPEGYTVRPYEPDDLAGFLRLDSTIWGRDRGAAWFRWKYVTNPFVDHVPIFVAEADDTIVGARPFIAFRLRIGNRRVAAFQPADTMVHPDHRRAGVFAQMNRAALSYYADRSPTFFFNFPNEYARPGYLKLGWRAVSPEVTYYRVERPTAMQNGSKPAQKLLMGAVTPFLQGYYTVREAFAPDPDGITTRMIDGIAHTQLETLHRRRKPPIIHADRSREFIQWRFASPVWQRRTYLMSDDSGLIAAIIGRTRTTSDSIRLTQIVDVAPLTGGARWKTALRAGIRTLVSTHPETDLFAVSEGAIPHEILAAAGFIRDDRPPLSKLTTFDSVLTTRPNADPTDESAWQVAGRRIDDSDNWSETFAERDTS